MKRNALLRESSIENENVLKTMNILSKVVERKSLLVKSETNVVIDDDC